VNGGLEHANPAATDWEQWLVQHIPKFLLFARQQTRFEVDAHDLVQEAVLECWRRVANDAPPTAGLIYSTIRRRAIDLGRSMSRRATREAAAVAETSAVWFDGTLEDNERSMLIQDAMQKLPEMYREVVTLKVWGELTFAEIAQVLEIPANTAASRYRYGLMELRKQRIEELV